MKKQIIVAMGLSLLLTSACGGGGGSYSTADYKSAGGGDHLSNSMIATESMVDSYDGSFDGDYAEAPSEPLEEVNPALQKRKLITTMNMDVETKAFDELLPWIEHRVTEVGGYIESMDVYNGSSYGSDQPVRNASMTLRIPAANLSGFVEEMQEKSNIVRQNTSVEDVTLSYVDAEARRDTYRAEQKSLLSILEDAETIEEVLAVRSQLTDVNYQLESAERQIRSYDNRINFDTIHLSVDEVETLTPVEEPTVVSRIVEGFGDNLHAVCDWVVDVFVWLVTHIPQIVLLVIIVTIVLFVRQAMKPYMDKHKKAKAKQAKKNPGTYAFTNNGVGYGAGEAQQSEEKKTEVIADKEES